MKLVCKKCSKLKSADSFGLSSKAKSGFRSTCRECEAAAARHRYATDKEFRKKAIEKATLYQRAGFQRDYSREYQDKHKTTPKRTNSTEVNRKHNAKYPEKFKARTALRSAMLRGDLVKAPCLICGKAESEAHHQDYSKPLEVMWFCKLHHRGWERLFC